MKCIFYNLQLALPVGMTMLLFAYLSPSEWQQSFTWKSNIALLGSPNRQEVVGTKMTTDEDVTNKPMYVHELLEHIQSIDDIRFDFSALQQRLAIREGEDEAMILGRLTIFLRHKRGVQDAGVNSYLNDLEGKEWAALFKDVLRCPVSLDQPYSPGDNLNERHEKFRLKFQQAIPEHPMLARIWDTYIDITYEPEEIGELRDECLKTQAIAASHPVALKGLSKLISACDEALRLESGLLLSSD
jgi:hypothetical protein